MEDKKNKNLEYIQRKIKYANYQIVFREIPDEITLAINISNCPNNCKGCHSSYLQDDIGYELTEHSLKKLIDNNSGITCVCFMGGDLFPKELNELAFFVLQNYSNLKVGIYSGLNKINSKLITSLFDYIKIGEYLEDLGPLNSPTTNQKLLKKDITFKDITKKVK
jgi:anaerobic ribonucleoside-triphosphate reductase activating protein